MKLILNEQEMLLLVKRSFPPEMIPPGHKVEGVETKGYPIKEFIITIDKEVEE